MKVAVHSSLHSCPIDMRYHYYRWGEMCDVLAVDIRRGFSFSTYIWVAYMRLLLGSITWRLFVIYSLLLHELLTLMQLWVTLVSSMP